jgi:hypothetical protein
MVDIVGQAPKNCSCLLPQSDAASRKYLLQCQRRLRKREPTSDQNPPFPSPISTSISITTIFMLKKHYICLVSFAFPDVLHHNHFHAEKTLHLFASFAFPDVCFSKGRRGEVWGKKENLDLRQHNTAMQCRQSASAMLQHGSHVHQLLPRISAPESPTSRLPARQCSLRNQSIIIINKNHNK